MALTYQLILLLGLSGLWMGADADCKTDCCMVCPDGWFAHNTRCFQFVGAAKNWSESEAECVKRGGNLASVYNDELISIRDLVFSITGRRTRTWLGGNDIISEGDWFWTSGEVFAFTGWHGSEPNNGGRSQRYGEEDCMELLGYKQIIYNDAPCRIKKASLCARSKVPAP